MKILNKLTLKNLFLNKKRTIITILGIALSSMLMFLVSTAAGTYKQLHYQYAVDIGGDQQVIYDDVPLEKLDLFENNDSIDKYYFLSEVGQIEYLNDGITLYSFNDNFYGDMNLNGQLPKNNQEIVISREVAALKKIKLNDNHIFKVDGLDKEYRVVGIYNSNRLFNTETAITYDNTIKSTGKFFVYFKSYDDMFNKINTISYSLDFSSDDPRINANTSLISLYVMYGKGAYSQAIMILVTMLLMLIIGFIVLFVIYNSFAISVNERKKTFAMFKSVGASKNQILKTVLFEGFILSILAIPIGFILNLLVGFIAINALNNILESIILFPFKLHIDLLFILLSLFYIISCVFIACFMPAKRASESTIINTIRQNTEITKKGSLFKENKLVSKIFKIEGVISRKNIIRNYRKYNVTTFSVIIGIILFLTVSTVVNAFDYISKLSNQASGIENTATLGFEFNKEYEEQISSFKNYTDYFKFYSTYKLASINSDDLIVHDYRLKNASIFILDEKVFNEIATINDLKNKNIVTYNSVRSYQTDDFGGATLKDSTYIFNKDEISAEIIDYYTNEKKPITATVVNKLPDYFENYLNVFNMFGNPIIFINYSVIENSEETLNVNYAINSDEPFELDKEIKQFLLDNNLSSNYMYDYLYFIETIQLIKAFTFIAYLVLLIIGIITVTSIVNTVNTNMELRRREFSVLKSIGLSNKSFNKMILFESLMLSFKALSFGLLLSILIMILVIKALLVQMSYYGVAYQFIPFKYIMMCIVLVFLIVYVSMIVSTRKFKNDNIIDAIKDEIM